jgi:hypothetical protein
MEEQVRSLLADKAGVPLLDAEQTGGWKARGSEGGFLVISNQTPCTSFALADVCLGIDSQMGRWKAQGFQRLVSVNRPCDCHVIIGALRQRQALQRYGNTTLRQQ